MSKILIGNGGRPAARSPWPVRAAQPLKGPPELWPSIPPLRPTPTHNELSAARVVVLQQVLSFQPRSYGQPLGLRLPGFRGYVILSWVKGRGQGGQARRLVLGERHLGTLPHNCACAAPRPALFVLTFSLRKCACA